MKASPAMNRKAKQWEDKLNANNAGAQDNAEDFTKQFMKDMYSQSSMTNIETRQESMKMEEKQVMKGNQSIILMPMYSSNINYFHVIEYHLIFVINIFRSR